MKLDVPDVLKRDHGKLLLDLKAASIGASAVAAAARRLLALLLDHLEREEEYAFRLLGLLPHLVDGTIAEEMLAAIPASDRLRVELRRLRQDHVMIVGAIGELIEAERRAGKREYARLADDLLEHARMEEAILYPAALVVGDYVRLRLAEIDAPLPPAVRAS
jgi:hypothetical protein